MDTVLKTSSDAMLTKAILHVHSSSGTLQNTKGLHNGIGHAVLRLVDIEIAQRAIP